ncbi:stage II sporulation protein M [Lachnospiraceae bacterium KM106-2]|nr:stage II sporulation protein M [Lachnospiraceae bacterium KM106-2]
MNQIRNPWKQFSSFQYFVIFLLLGVLLGTIYANLFQTMYAKSFLLFNAEQLTNQLSENVNATELFFTCVIQHLKEFTLLWILSITILGRPFLYLQTTYKGVLIGFLVSTFTMRYGVKGILGFLSMQFPHQLILVPLYIFSFIKAYELNRRVYGASGAYRSVILSESVKYIPLIIIILVLTILASLLEAYLNSGIILKVMLSLQ